MTIDWSEEGLVVFTMYDYLEDIIADAPDCFDGEDNPRVQDFKKSLHKRAPSPFPMYSLVLIPRALSDTHQINNNTAHHGIFDAYPTQTTMVFHTNRHRTPPHRSSQL